MSNPSRVSLIDSTAMHFEHLHVLHDRNRTVSADIQFEEFGDLSFATDYYMHIIYNINIKLCRCANANTPKEKQNTKNPTNITISIFDAIYEEFCDRLYHLPFDL